MTACTAIPVRESNVQGMPKPIASIWPPTAVADLLHRVGDHLHEFVLRQAVDKTVGTVNHRQVRADRPRQQLRAAEVDADDVALGHRATLPIRHGRPSRRRRAPVHAVPREAEVPAPARRRRWPARDAGASRAARRTRSAAAAGAPRRAGAGAGSASGASCAGSSPALVAWLAISLVLFLVSAQIQSSKVSDAADNELGGGGYPLTSPNTILVLGSDARTKGTKEPGAKKIGQPQPLGLDPAAAHRRRPQRDALDPARHRRRHPRPRPEQDQRRVRHRRPGARDPHRRALPRHPGQPPGRGQLRELPGADRRARRRHLPRRLRRLARSTAASRTAATRCA